MKELTSAFLFMINYDYPSLIIWGLILYVLFFAIIVFIALHFFILRRQQRISDARTRFFTNIAHDIRTPLTLIKAPLEELREKEQMSEDGRSNVNIAIRNVDVLLHLTTNLVNLEKIDTYIDSLYVSEYELSTYMEELLAPFKTYAKAKHINLTYESNFHSLKIWLDRDKMDSILKNIISDTLKYTSKDGEVQLRVTEANEAWNVEIRNTGSYMEINRSKSLFTKLFSDFSSPNIETVSSGIGVLLVRKLVHLHKGKIKINHIPKNGIYIKVSFPKGEKKYSKAKHCPSKEAERIIYSESGVPQAASLNTLELNTTPPNNKCCAKILVVENNEELSGYLQKMLSDKYMVKTCNDGKQVLKIAQEETPDLIVSDAIMPEIPNGAICNILKSNIETSHIPIVLMTALNNDQGTVEGLNSDADEYLLKPFNISILKATIDNLLANRALLRHKYANLEISDEQHNPDCINCSSDLDWKFIATVKKSVEDNMEDSTFNIDTLCNLMNMSRTSFYNKIKALTDQAPADYARLIRLKHAAQLLEEQRYSITEIAERTGFSDAKYFREVFKKHFKVSPSQYAKKKDNRQ